MGMFKPREGDDRLTANEMRVTMTTEGSTCQLHGTTAAGMVVAQYKQQAWCPLCGLPPTPMPSFMKGDK